MSGNNPRALVYEEVSRVVLYSPLLGPVGFTGSELGCFFGGVVAGGLAMPLGMWDRSSSTRDPMLSALKAQSLNHWTSREVWSCF